MGHHEQFEFTEVEENRTRNEHQNLDNLDLVLSCRNGGNFLRTSKSVSQHYHFLSSLRILCFHFTSKYIYILAGASPQVSIILISTCQPKKSLN